MTDNRAAKIEANKILIGKEVNVNLDGGWSGVVKEVVDFEYVIVSKNGIDEKVSLFDIC